MLAPNGSVLASAGVDSQVGSELQTSRAVKLVMHGAPYALGDLVGTGKAGVIDIALGLPTSFGRRMLVEGVAPSELSGLLTGELRRIPGVNGSRNLILDANDTVIASNVSSRPPGYRYTGRAARAALGRSTGDRNGRFYDEVALRDSTWRIVLASPDGPLFASVSGLHRWVPWLLFIAFGAGRAGRARARLAHRALRRAGPGVRERPARVRQQRARGIERPSRAPS